MPFFNFRRNGSTPSPNASAAQHESVEVVRKRAKQRLIGAAVLVLAGVVGFPLLFDTQPRPIAIDIPIEIPGKNTVKPLGAPVIAPVVPPVPAAPDKPIAAAPSTAPDKVAAASSLSSKEEIIAEKRPVAPVKPAPVAPKTEAKPTPKAESKVEAKVESKPESRPESKPLAKAAPPTDDGARARALLNGQPAAQATPAAASAAAGADSRIVVQVGAFSDANKAREVRLKLEKAGMKTYTQVAETAGGKRIRVRVGPFATRADADKAASKIKSLDLQAAVLTL